ncbi:MAG: carboxypeptidase-like regulatory domain-containing protein, partial [Ferruginibacter sp.]
MRLTILIILHFLPWGLYAQVNVSGTVFEISGSPVEFVRVESTGGIFAITDSSGKFRIPVNVTDSISFIYNTKPTQKFPVKDIKYPDQFDISLKISVQSRYSLLKEVKVYSRSYKQDSLENRAAYSDIFAYEKPRVKSVLSPGGVAGADINELANIFRFKRNKQLRAFQKRLFIEEEEKYVNYRFSKIFVTRLTGLAAA